uniref:Uncharacterized protein n=1 Tax=Anguilla anguilla TaxID=7936 RepID=A0A0E9TU76_ANGAN
MQNGESVSWSIKLDYFIH